MLMCGKKEVGKMTDRELQKLKRSELLEIMLGLQNELDWLKKENKDLKTELDNRRIALEKSGSIAQAALEVNGVFTAAQKAADVYLENIKQMHENEEKNYNEQIAKAKVESESIVNSAKREAEAIISKTENESRTRLRKVEEECSKRINETNTLCTRKIKETQEKCTAISSLDNQIATFFNDNHASDGTAQSAEENNGEQKANV